MVELRDVGSKAELDALCATSSQVVLHFWASWCEPCKSMDDVLRELGRQHPGIAIGRVEAEVADELTIQFNVATVPTFVLLQAGVVVDSLEGADPPTLTAKVAALTGKTSTGVTNGATAAVAAAPAAGSDVVGRIKFLMSSHPVLLFMKGNPETPRCGFSRKVVAALKEIQVTFHTVDILEDDALRQGVKEWGNWPTYPQLYVAGELLGGCDIVLEMAQGSDLKDAILKGTASLSKPSLPTTSTPAAAAAAAASEGLSSADAQRARLTALVRSSPVMLFMKGRPEAPQCGFSSAVVGALREAGIAFGSFDILSDGAVRSGLKEFSQWPTYPQVYVNGELLGGADIVKEMAASGELKEAVAGMLAA